VFMEVDVVVRLKVVFVEVVVFVVVDVVVDVLVVLVVVVLFVVVSVTVVDDVVEVVILGAVEEVHSLDKAMSVHTSRTRTS